MTTTLAALQAGNAHLQFVLALDGYPHVFSCAPESAVQTAYATTDWATTTVIPNLTIELDAIQRISPWNPFESAGKLVFHVQPDADDTFGIDTARSDAGAETLLEETVDRVQPLFVGFADGFALTGDAHVGTECFDYGFIAGRTLKTAPGLVTGSNRGKYVAHGAKDSTTTYGHVRFAEHHRVAVQNNGVRFQPVVSAQPRTWTGRRVSLWAHTYDAGAQALNTKADALCLFIGEISEPQDTETGSTSVLCEHLLDKIPKTTLLRDQWTARADYGMRLQAGQKIKFQDQKNSATKIANDLVVVASGASGTNQVDAGLYGQEEIASIVNAWLGGEVAAGRIYGNYTMATPEDDSGTPKTGIHYFVPGATTDSMSFRFTWPASGWAVALGYPGLYYNNFDTCGAHHRAPSTNSPQPMGFVDWEPYAGGTLRIAFEASVGIFQGQNATLPAAAKALMSPTELDGTKDVGLFMIESETPILVLAQVIGNELRYVRPLTGSFASNLPGLDQLMQGKVPLGSGPPVLRQIFVHEGPCKTVLKWLAYSTGTSGYNGPFDVLPNGQGLNIPYDALGTTFETSCDALPGANDLMTVTLEKPRTVNDLIRADLVVRNAHLIFQDGHFKFVSWVSPADATATTVLDEDNKAEPIDTRISQRTASVLDSSWVKNYLKLNYNRDLSASIGGGEDAFLATPLIIEDATSIDDMGGNTLPVTLDLRNVVNDTDQIGQGVRQLAANFLAWKTLWSRPLWKLRRSIAPTLYTGFGAGTVAAVTDPFVRDPTTGARGITTRAGLVIGHRYQIITSSAPDKIKFAGECDVVFLHTDRTFAYAPAAEVDYTKNDGGFTAGYDGNSTLQFEAHAHSESSETVDVGAFAEGDRVRIIEIDPSDPTAAISWQREIDVVIEGNNQVILTSTLVAPAFDTAKRYRMVYDVYANAAGLQTIKSFQAGDTKYIGTSSPPDVYGVQTSTVTPTEYDHSRVPELMSNLSYGPNVGAARDCGYDKELALLLDNMMDHQTRRSSPVLMSSASTNSSNVGWQILHVEMRFIGNMILSGSIQRYLWIAPYWRTDGTGSGTPQLRVSVSGYPPSGTSNVNLDNATPGYTIKAPAAGNTWSAGVADTLWRNDTAQGYPLGNFNGHQFVYVIVEGQKSVSFQGFCQLSESERVTV